MSFLSISSQITRRGLILKHSMDRNFGQLSYTPLLPIIKSELRATDLKSRQGFEKRIYKIPLAFSLVEYKGHQFVSDLTHTIQLLISFPNPEPLSLKIATSPSNSIETRFYKPINEATYDFWQPYNCHASLITEELADETHAYSPQFLMRKSYDEFKRKKPYLNEIYLSSRTIRIYQWRIKIVNMSRTGWYAPVVEAFQVKIEDGFMRKQNFNRVSLVLYEREVKEAMETLRLQDLREIHKDKFDRIGSVSLCFFIRQQEADSQISNIVRVDKKQDKLKFDQKKAIKYLPLGNMEGSVVTTEKLDDLSLNTDKIQQNLYKTWQVLMNPSLKRQDTAYRQTFNSAQQDLLNWSDDSADQNLSGGDKLNSGMMEEDEESDGSEEDFLRQLYKQQAGLHQLRIL